MSDLTNISLFDILSAPTQERTNVEKQIEIDESDFSQELIRPVADHVIEDDDIEDYDAAAEAKKLVNMIDSFNAMGLSMIGHWKLTKRRGGKDGIKQMRSSYIKESLGQELSDVEKLQLKSFENYKSDLALLNGEVRFSEFTRQMLIENATSMCEESKLKFNKNMAFWTILLTAEAEKIYKILTL